MEIYYYGIENRGIAADDTTEDYVQPAKYVLGDNYYFRWDLKTMVLLRRCELRAYLWFSNRTPGFDSKMRHSDINEKTAMDSSSDGEQLYKHFHVLAADTFTCN